MGLMLLFEFVLGALFSWISLMIVVPIARMIMQFSLPPWPETMWKLAVVASTGTLISMIFDPISTFLGWVLGAIVFFAFMRKWFDVDLLGLIVIVVVSWIINALLTVLLVGTIAGALS